MPPMKTHKQTLAQNALGEFRNEPEKEKSFMDESVEQQ